MAKQTYIQVGSFLNLIFIEEHLYMYDQVTGYRKSCMTNTEGISLANFAKFPKLMHRRVEITTTHFLIPSPQSCQCPTQLEKKCA